MSLFGLFGKKTAEQKPQQEEQKDYPARLEAYSGIRVEVTTMDGQLLFVAKLLYVHEDKAELHPYSEVMHLKDKEPLRARIRGYLDHEKKAVLMEGTISPAEKNIWTVEELVLHRVGNDRAFFRLDTDLEATATMFSGLEIGEKGCRLLNISIGGACIRSKYRYHEGDKFLLKVRLMEDRPISAIFSQVMRIIEKNNDEYEYGCQFLELTEEDQEKITKNIFDAQVQSRRRN